MSNIPSISSTLLVENSKELAEMVHRKDISEVEKLKKTSEAFEGIFVRQFLDKALNPMMQGCLKGSQSEHEIRKQFIVEILSNEITKSGLLGITNEFQAQISQSNQIPLKENQ